MVKAATSYRKMSNAGNSQDLRETSKLSETRTCISSELMNSWILLMLLLLRPHNMALVAMLVFLEKCVSCIMQRVDMPAWCITMMYLMLGQASFFYQVYQ